MKSFWRVDIKFINRFFLRIPLLSVILFILLLTGCGTITAGVIFLPLLNDPKIKKGLKMDYAIQGYGGWEQVETAIEAGADPNYSFSSGMWYDSNPLQNILGRYYYPVTEQMLNTLIDGGADINRRPYVWYLVFKGDNKELAEYWNSELERKEREPSYVPVNRETLFEELISGRNQNIEMVIKGGADPDGLGHPKPFSRNYPFGNQMDDKKAAGYFSKGSRPLNLAIEKGMVWESQVDLLLNYTILDKESLNAAIISNDPQMIAKIENLWREQLVRSGGDPSFVMPGNYPVDRDQINHNGEEKDRTSEIEKQKETGKIKNKKNDLKSSGGFEYINQGGGFVTVCGYSGGESVIEIPNRVGLLMVTDVDFTRLPESVKVIKLPYTIREVRLDQCHSLTDIVYSESPKTLYIKNCNGFKELGSLGLIENITLDGCNGLTEFFVPKSCSHLIINNCNRLEKVNLMGFSLKGLGYSDEYTKYKITDCPKLSDINYLDSLTEINRPSLNLKGNNIRINLPESLETVTGRFFQECDGVTEINISDEAKNFKSKDGVLFDKSGKVLVCYPSGKSEKVYTVPELTVQLGPSSFFNCSELEEIIMPDSVEILDSCVFRDCRNLIKISFSPSLRKVGDYAFAGCTAFKKIGIPNSVKKMGSSVFEGCSDLEKVIIPDSVEEMGTSVFERCENLTEVTLSNSLDKIRYETFSGCTNLTSIIIPNSITAIGKKSFENCSELKNVFMGNKVKDIGEEAFRGCFHLEEIIFPDSLKEIEESAFSDCASLTTLIFPDSLTTIKRNAFSGCRNLQKIKLPDSLTHIGKYAFEGCERLTIEKIPDSLEITPFQFSGCSGVKELIIPSGMKRIDKMLFFNYSGLEKVIIPDSVIEIDSNAFRGCTHLKEVILPDSLEEIGAGAFEDCLSLTEIRIPPSVKQIGRNAFSGCTGLTEMIIPETVEELGLGLFLYCTALERVTILSSAPELGSYFFMGCTNLSEVNISDSVKRIGRRAFFGCSNLNKIVLPSSVEEISSQAFGDCTGLKEFFIPGSVAVTGADIFCFSSHLKSIYCESPKKRKGWNREWNRWSPAEVIWNSQR